MNTRIDQACTSIIHTGTVLRNSNSCSSTKYKVMSVGRRARRVSI
eukprot:COSAG02_NODE_1881_length_10542_cov_179.778991_3_plen_45_part_00